ncbi:MAG: FAD-binding oxidoreductase, partial [Sulfolobales archaeon]
MTLGLYSTDAVSFPIIPKDLSEKFVVAMPRDPREVVEVVKFCYKNKIPLIPQGSSTSLALGSSVVSLSSLNQLTILDKGVILYTGFMKRIIELSKVDRYVIVEPGVRIDELNDLLSIEKTELFFPVDPASARAATVGGAIASGAGGLRGARYGTMREWVLALEFVDGLGRVHRVGCRTIKCRQGYDITKLLVGSEGTLGIITSATLKLWPKPRKIIRTLYFTEKFIEGYEVFLRIREVFGVPLISEYLSDRIIRKIYETTGISFGEGHAFIIDLELDRYTNTDLVKKDLEKILGDNRVKNYVIAEDHEKDFDKIYFLRRSMYPSTLKTRKMKYIITEDIVVPISKIPEYVEFVEKTREKYKRDIEIGGHLGDGNLHPKLEGDLDDPRDRDLVMKIAREIVMEAVKLGGSISAEHGIGTMKIEFLLEEFRYRESEHTIDLMKNLKRIFDPANILNPG